MIGIMNKVTAYFKIPLLSLITRTPRKDWRPHAKTWKQTKDKTVLLSEISAIALPIFSIFPPSTIELYDGMYSETGKSNITKTSFHKATAVCMVNAERSGSILNRRFSSIVSIA